MTTSHTRRGASALVAAILALGLAQSASAQAGPLSVEARIGVTLPVGDFGEGLEGNFGFEGDVMYAFTPNLSAFAGYGWNGFKADEAGFEDPSLSGFQAGLKIVTPRPGSASPWARVELLYHRMDVGAFESDRSFGFGAAVGVDVGLSPAFSLVPAVRFRTLSPEADGVELGDARYLMVDIGGRFDIG